MHTHAQQNTLPAASPAGPIACESLQSPEYDPLLAKWLTNLRAIVSLLSLEDRFALR
jgi:hypothetical protein